MQAVAVVGDVHGEARKLREMLRLLASFRGRVVFVGDYVSGGPDSAEVLEILASTARTEAGRFVFLCGNHDLAFLRYLDYGDFARFAAEGGLATLASYLPIVTGDVATALRDAIPPAHVTFLRGLSAYWESDDCLVSHAGFDPAAAAARDVETMTQPKGRPLSDLAVDMGKLAICGHYVQPEGPFNGPRLICVDTGCGVISGGQLTAVLLPERRFVSTS